MEMKIVDETSKIIKEIKQIAKNIDSTNTCEVNTSLCDIIDLCNKII